MSQQSSLIAWLKRRKSSWNDVADKVEHNSGKSFQIDSYEDSISFSDEIRSLASDLSLSRVLMPGNRLTTTLEQLLIRANILFNQPATKPFRELLHLYRYGAKSLFAELQFRIYLVTLLFLFCMLVGWILVSNFPELISLFASEEMIEKVQQGELWTDGLLNIMPSSVLAIQIIANNVMVTIFAYALGVFYGLGTLYIISLNGLMLGSILAFTHQYGLLERIVAFIFPHGVVELSVICIAGAAGVSLGEALARPGQMTRQQAFQKSTHQAGQLLAISIPFLIGAGIIEGYISPNESYPMWSRVVVGLAYELIFLSFLTGRIWRDKPNNFRTN